MEKLGGFTKTGADEIPLTLLARAVKEKIKVYPKFLEPDYKNLISNYEDISIEKSVLGQLELANCEVSNEIDADVILIINNFIENQGEIVMKKSTKLFDREINPPDKPYIIADVRLANGADNNFVNKIMMLPADKNFLGYAGWNTSANTLGSLICGMKFAFVAIKQKKFDSEAFKKFETIRFLDDWAYQANIRQELTSPDSNTLYNNIKPYEKQVKGYLNTNFSTKYSFPWNRLFEVKVDIN